MKIITFKSRIQIGGQTPPSKPRPASPRKLSRERGFTIFELLLVMGLALLMGGIAILNLKAFDNPLQNGSAQLAGFLKQVRAKAISSTSAYIISPGSSGRIQTQRGLTCADASPVDDPLAALSLPSGAYLFDTTWNFCFNSRGLPDANIEIELRDIGGANEIVEVLLGGAVRIQ
jgi:type II secretory pathway pseudopilin PulG